MTKQILANKDRGFGLYSLAFERIKQCEKIKGEVIRFPKIFEKLCRSYSIKKHEAWELIYLFKEFDLIEIKPYHGIKIK